jgi:hypothetical protein
MPLGTTLLWGCANPEGVATSDGIFLGKDDIKNMIDQVNERNCRGEPVPVHIEHKGIAIGRVISAWEHNGKMECVLSLNERVFEGSLSSELVRAGMCKDLSLGYEVSIENSKKSMRVRGKKLKEISVVRKGARHSCHIHGVCNKSSSK